MLPKKVQAFYRLHFSFINYGIKLNPESNKAACITLLAGALTNY